MQINLAVSNTNKLTTLAKNNLPNVTTIHSFSYDTMLDIQHNSRSSGYNCYKSIDTVESLNTKTHNMHSVKCTTFEK